MEITVSKRFLRVPVKFDGTSQKFTFSENGTPVYKFDAVYTEENADAIYYADLRDYLGKTMTVTVEPECAFTPVFEDAMGYGESRTDPCARSCTLQRSAAGSTIRTVCAFTADSITFSTSTIPTADCGATCIGATP